MKIIGFSAFLRFWHKFRRCLLILLLSATTSHARETLPNGIVLPDVWPPMVGSGVEPMAVPYLEKPPKVIAIDRGRQLFVDDFLIASTTLERTYHRPKYHPASPVLKPEKAWERADDGDWAAPYSDGVWFEPSTRKFMMWYQAAERRTCLAVSDDGIRWTRPKFDIEPETNVVLTSEKKASQRDSNTVWLDLEATDPKERFKLFETRYAKSPYRMALRTSSDGIHWSPEKAESARSWDRSTAYYDPFRKLWVASVRGHDHDKGEPPHRLRNYFEGKSAAEAVSWKQDTDEVSKGRLLPNDLIPWVGADRLDPPHPDPKISTEKPQLYNLDVFPYESLLVGLFTIWRGPTNEVCAKLNVPKLNEVFVGYTRDGFHWHRPDRQPFLPASNDPKAWNAGNVQSAGGGCVVVGDELYFYCSGRTTQPRPITSTGLATMRRDGFASMDAPKEGGELLTRPVLFTGKRLFVNATLGDGKMLVEVIGADGKVLKGFHRDDCRPLTGDLQQGEIRWQGDRDLDALRGQAVQIRFVLTHGSLWTFWVAKE